jgi:hypothetical protein
MYDLAGTGLFVLAAATATAAVWLRKQEFVNQKPFVADGDKH